MTGRSSRSRLSRGVVLGLIALITAGLAYGFWPRRADLRAFHPAGVARIETAMWRDYYRRDYPGLFRGLYDLSRREYGFSPWDSLCLAWYAARAAGDFQPSRSRARARQALPALERYFALIRRRGGERFAPRRAARLELEWWQLRREGASPARIGEVIAQVSSELYGVSNAQVKRAARLRAEMMRYRDERRQGRMQPRDWAYIERNLSRSYQDLRSGVSRARAGRG